VDELTKLRKAAGIELFMLLLLRWTGLRGSDAVNLKWDNVRFDRGVRIPSPDEIREIEDAFQDYKDSLLPFQRIGE
jgi:integrase